MHISLPSAFIFFIFLLSTYLVSDCKISLHAGIQYLLTMKAKLYPFLPSMASEVNYGGLCAILEKKTSTFVNSCL